MNEDRESLQQVASERDALISNGMPREAPSNHINDDIEPCVTTVDEIFEKIGPCGRYQYLQAVALCILSIPIGYQMFIMYFTGHSPNWRCVNGTNSACNITGEISPADVDQFNSRCRMPRQSWEYVTPRNFSFITEFDLICDKNPIAAFSHAVMYIAWGFGSIPLGIAADHYGRTPVLFTSYIIILVMLLSSSFVTAVWQFILLRALIGFFLTGHGMPIFALGAEIVGTKFRSLIVNALLGIETAGIVILTTQAYYIQEWRRLTIVCSAPYIGCIVLFWFIYESPRWLTTQGHASKATKIMKKISVMNKRQYSIQQISQVCGTRKSHGSLINLFRPARQLLKTLSLSFAWMIAALGFFGISLAAGDLSGSMYRDFVLVSLIELPAIPLTVLLLERLGRRGTTAATMVGAGIFCCSVIIFPQKSQNQLYSILRIGFGMAAKLCNVIAYGALYVWTGELYPTTIRTQGLSFGSLSARLGATPAPFLTESLKLINPSLPFILIGSLSILSGLTSLLLPETVGKPTLESFAADITEPCESNGSQTATCHVNADYTHEDNLDVQPHRKYEEEPLIQPGRQCEYRN